MTKTTKEAIVADVSNEVLAGVFGLCRRRPGGVFVIDLVGWTLLPEIPFVDGF